MYANDMRDVMSKSLHYKENEVIWNWKSILVLALQIDSWTLIWKRYVLMDHMKGNYLIICNLNFNTN